MDDALDGHYYNIIKLMKISLLFFFFGGINFSKAARTDRNLALKKPTEQSTTWSRFLHKSDNAVDGDFRTSGGAVCAEPNGGRTTIPWHWWMVDLQSVHTVGSFSFSIRTDQHHWTNHGFAVEVSIEDPKTLDGFPARTNASECLVKNTTIPWTIPRFTMQCEKPVQGRYVRVVKYPKTGKMVICEFEVFENAKGVREALTDRKNLALTKPTSIDGKTFQASPSTEDKPKRSQYMAVDGDRNSYAGSAGVCYTSQIGDPNVSPFIPFLVDLEGTYLIDTIFISNSNEEPLCLQNISVEVSMQVPSNVRGSPNESNLQECFRQFEPVPIGYMVEYKCNQPVVGRYVRLARFIESTSGLCLCELEVYGEPAFVSTQSITSLSSSTSSPINVRSTQPTEASLDTHVEQKWRYIFIKISGVDESYINNMSVRRMLSMCVRKRGQSRNATLMKYILTDIDSGECYFLETLDESERIPIVNSVIYKVMSD